jgi:hypothetical protein
MTGPHDPDARIAEFFQATQPDLPDRTFDAVRHDISRTRQVVPLGPIRMPGSLPDRWVAVAAAAALLVAVVLLDLRIGGGPVGGPGPTSTPSPAASPSAAAARPTGPTRFTSPLYGYTVTVPGGWLAARANVRWDGVKQPGPDAEADKFDGPEQLTAWAFAGRFDGDLASFTADRIAATARDHADTCPVAEPEFNQQLQIGDQPWKLVGWNCGALINMAVTVNGGVGYSFNFRDFAVKAARDPTDRALFLSILDTVVLPS